MTTAEFIAEAARHARHLADLLESPRPGLLHWSTPVNDELNWIGDWRDGKFAGSVDETHQSLTEQERIKS